MKFDVSTNETFILNRGLRNRRGQSLLLALLVMFLLVFVAGIFVTIIVRNIGRAQRSGEALGTEYFAEAGIRYADDQLTHSADGADWRPLPTYPEVVRSFALGQDPAGLAPEFLPDERDPDFFWLMRGFSRYTYGDGRFLVRVTYDPRPGDPMSKFIKIESIGRLGVVDHTDPTTWRVEQPMRARSEKVAYKAIGITDYVRFITNKDRRSGDLALGTPEFPTSFGIQGDNGRMYGGPIRVNGNLVWHGKNRIWLDPSRGEGVEVAGDIRHSIFSPQNPPPNATDVEVNGLTVLPSGLYDGNNVSLFDTLPYQLGNGEWSEVGLYRDGRMEQDHTGRPRHIFRLEPPRLDGGSPASGLGRYRDLTRNSGEWQWNSGEGGSEGNWYNTGYYGWGEGLYINNPHDIQRENILYTLRGDWINPGSSDYWKGPYYSPPGISIVLTPYDLNGNGHPDMILTRESAPGDAKFIWYDHEGNLLADTGEQMIMRYPQNGVIFAEGNVRIRGVLPNPEDVPSPQLTIVSGGTIYVEGNILKYRSDDGAPDPRSAISLLASDYVTVNTTQFFSLARGVFRPGNPGGTEPHFAVSPGMEGTFWLEFAFGRTPPDDPSLYVRHTSDGDMSGWSYMNLLVNPWSDPGLPGMYAFLRIPDFDFAYPLEGPREPLWEHEVFPLAAQIGSSYQLYDQPGVPNRLAFQFDESIRIQEWPKVDYLLSRVAVQPCDIIIEALMYAQNGSFFVIPGMWFNPDERDTPDAGQRPPDVNAHWPFHGDPLDVQIIIRGAVSENVPASISDVRAWMDKWGWIPSERGSSGELIDYRDPLDPDDASDPRGRGLTFVYDDLLSYPVYNGGTAIRYDSYGRLLPITPKLPVSPQTLFFGDPVL